MLVLTFSSYNGEDGSLDDLQGVFEDEVLLLNYIMGGVVDILLSGGLRLRRGINSWKNPNSARVTVYWR